MTAQRDNLVAAVAQLEKALAGPDAGPDAGPEASRQRLDAALAALVQAVDEHGRALDAGEGRVVDVESPRLPSPTVDRQVGQLHRELQELRGEAAAVRDRLAAGAATPDFGPLRGRVRRLLECLQRYNQDEARVILDSVTTDIGAGD
jgi:hypothetical protein